MLKILGLPRIFESRPCRFRKGFLWFCLISCVDGDGGISRILNMSRISLRPGRVRQPTTLSGCRTPSTSTNCFNYPERWKKFRLIWFAAICPSPLFLPKKIKWIIEIRNEFRKEFVPHADECPSPKWRTWNPGRRHGFHFFSHSLKPNEGLPDENWPDGSKRWRCETFNTIKNSQSWNMASENPIFGCCWKMRLTGNKTNSK